MVAIPSREVHEFEHFVQFCETDDFLITSVGKFISTGLMQGDVCIVLATPAHRDGFDEYLKADGSAVSVARACGMYISLDAASTLSQIMVDGSIDPVCFYRVIGEIIQQTVKSGHAVRIFGELVALLWAEGNRAGAIRLEELWNELARSYAFSLYCVYPMKSFDGEAYGMEFAEICRQHTRVIPGESYTTLTDPDERLRAISLLQQKSNSLAIEVTERKRKEAALEEFISVASHELKTPITSLKGFAYILHNRLRKRGDEESLRLLASIDKQLNRLTMLTNDLLDVTKMQQGRLDYDEELFCLDTLVRETIENLQARTSTHRLIFEGGESAQVYGDRERIGQVLMNLVTNAVKYSPAADLVIIRLSIHGDSATASVQDFGIGIAATHQEHIFERYYQVTGTAGKTSPGLGISLYLSSEIIKHHRGRMQVASEPCAGSTFSFTLPVVRAD